MLILHLAGVTKIVKNFFLGPHVGTDGVRGSNTNLMLYNHKLKSSTTSLIRFTLRFRYFPDLKNESPCDIEGIDTDSNNTLKQDLQYYFYLPEHPWRQATDVDGNYFVGFVERKPFGEIRSLRLTW